MYSAKRSERRRRITPPESHEMQQNTTYGDNLSAVQQMALNVILAGQNMTQSATPLASIDPRSIAGFATI